MTYIPVLSEPRDGGTLYYYYKIFPYFAPSHSDVFYIFQTASPGLPFSDARRCQLMGQSLTVLHL